MRIKQMQAPLRAAAVPQRPLQLQSTEIMRTACAAEFLGLARAGSIATLGRVAESRGIAPALLAELFNMQYQALSSVLN